MRPDRREMRRCDQSNLDASMFSVVVPVAPRNDGKCELMTALTQVLHVAKYLVTWVWKGKLMNLELELFRRLGLTATADVTTFVAPACVTAAQQTAGPRLVQRLEPPAWDTSLAPWGGH